ncbi:conserved oligomeric Golgi complex subunit 3 [Contarinia nasturtii]|uniref:conserved oligomeric Golgi complex subunit 3 n=1 Tax=Contarinia nasturtii TaxID=265458 RepID=UPI0012D457F5|nr:conserved oligomeric Golgi complex subunit 3 [Contarinia nasturtii]
MDDVASAHSENLNLRKIQQKLLQWEKKECSLSQLTDYQIDAIEQLNEPQQQKTNDSGPELNSADDLTSNENVSTNDNKFNIPTHVIDSTQDFFSWYHDVESQLYNGSDDIYRQYFEQLSSRRDECDNLLDKINFALKNLDGLKTEYNFVSNKTWSLNSGSEKLIAEQNKLIGITDEIKRRLHYFTQAENLLQILQSPTISVSSEIFAQTLTRVDDCIAYIKANNKFKDSPTYLAKHNQCLAKAVLLIKNYLNHMFTNTADQIANMKDAPKTGDQSSDAAFAMYYGKFQGIAPKASQIINLVESRIEQNVEYELLLNEIHKMYLTQRAGIMSSEIEVAIKNLTASYKGDHCALVRSSCAFMVHVCQDEHRLFYQFFTKPSHQLTSYSEGICTILYDTLRPYIIHINHLETLAEICGILRIEMLDEHVAHHADSLEAFGKICLQLLQDVQERLVFRAHLYLQSDILNYKPSGGDLAYPEKLEMMESIANSLNETMMRSSASIVSMSSVHDSKHIPRSSPADLHGMWYPTVRRTLVCLSRLYRCIDRPVFQSLSQEALSYCIQSVSHAAQLIATKKTSIDGELFEIKHLLIIREQIAPFRVDFTVRETSLDFSKTKTAAFSLLQKRKQLFAMDSNNALLEFLVDSTPQIKEHLHDSRKDVDRHLKLICENFIRDATNLLIGPVVSFIERAQNLLKANATTPSDAQQQLQQGAGVKTVNYVLRQTTWASPQQISGVIQESQRLIKSKLSGLQRAMLLYLANKDTEFILFRPIRNNCISAFVKLEQLLTTNGYTKDDMIITSCPTADQISILLSNTSLVAEDNKQEAARKFSTTSNSGREKGIKEEEPKPSDIEASSENVEENTN